MNAQHESEPAAADTGAMPGGQQPSEDELRAAYEQELNRVSSAELMLQFAVSLLNLAGRRLGLAAAGPEGERADTAGGRDLEQVREAIDGVRALFSVLERRFAKDLGPLRDALSQLQLAYARELQASAADSPSAGEQGAGEQGAAEQGAPSKGAGGEQAAAAHAQKAGPEQGPETHPPGPAEASGRLWVPGR